MAAVRRFPTPLLWAGLLVQPACVVTSSKPAPPPVPAPVAHVVAESSPPAGSQFAELIRAPGERVPLAEGPTVVQTRDETFEPLPAVPVPKDPPEKLPPIVTTPPPSPPPDPPLVAAVRAYADNRPELAAEHLKGFDPANRELMAQLLPAVVRASRMDLGRAGPTEVGALAGQLQAPTDALAARSPLGLDRACFCRWVKNFGRYDPVPDGTPFKPGSVAELYVEVRNVPSVPATAPADGVGFVTHLACTLQVRDTAGAVVELTDKTGRPSPALTETKRDVTRSPLRDYFLLFRFQVPARPGTYGVSVEVRDPATGRHVSRTVPLRVQ